MAFIGIRMSRGIWPNLMLLVLLTTVISWGCGRERRSPQRGDGTTSSTGNQDEHFDRAIDYLHQLDQFEPQQGMQKVAYHLNRWIEADDAMPEAAWSPDPMLEQLPAVIRESAQWQELARQQFKLDDVRFLREVYWLSGLSSWVATETTVPEFDSWLESVEQERGEEAAYDLRAAICLFDWTVRNVQLAEMLPSPADDGSDENQRIGAISNARPGPGYKQFVWQTLLAGQGDAFERARVFIALARQLEIDVVMLAYFDNSGQLKPWLPAVVADQQLFLFDTELGLPIPGNQGRGVATLSEVRNDVKLLRSLEVGAQFPYPASRANLDRVVALIDVAPEYLTLRMQLVESNLSADQQMILTFSPSRVAEQLRQQHGFAADAVRLWSVPWETFIYREAFERLAAADPAMLRQKILNEWFFDTLHPMVRGRQLHFLGEFENRDEDKGAMALYLDARLPDSVLNQIETSTEIQARLGIFRRRESDQEWANRLQVEKLINKKNKQHASYWLALAHYDTGDYEAARQWLERRSLDSDEPNPWTAGAQYNLSRTLERLGELEEARRLLLLIDSPQKHGNLLRARAMQDKLDSSPDPATADTPAKQ